MTEEIDPEYQKFYFSFVKRFKGLENIRQFMDHLKICPKCYDHFVKIIAHMEEKEKETTK